MSKYPFYSISEETMTFFVAASLVLSFFGALVSLLAAQFFSDSLEWCIFFSTVIGLLGSIAIGAFMSIPWDDDRGAATGLATVIGLATGWFLHWLFIGRHEKKVKKAS